MSEYMFGITKKTVTKAVAKQINEICIDQGGTGFTGPVNIPGNDNKGWFTTRDGMIAQRVAADTRRAIEAAGLAEKLGW